MIMDIMQNNPKTRKFTFYEYYIEKKVARAI